MRKNMYRFYFFCHDCCWHYIAYLHSCDELCASRGRCTRTYCCCCANYGAQSVRHKLHLAACRTSPPLLSFPSLLLLLLLLLPLLFLLVVNIVAALLCFVAADLNLLAYAVCRCSKTKRDRERERKRGRYRMRLANKLRINGDDTDTDSMQSAD